MQPTLKMMTEVKSDMKSNEQSQVYKLSTPMQIREVTLNIHDARGSKKVSEVSIYINNSQTAELSAIKRDKSAWTFIKTMKVNDFGNDNRCKFPVPITVVNLMFEFHVVQSNRTTTSVAKPYNSYSNPYGKFYLKF